VEHVHDDVVGGHAPAVIAGRAEQRERSEALSGPSAAQAQRAAVGADRVVRAGRRELQQAVIADQLPGQGPELRLAGTAMAPSRPHFA
jgi:hypothetical protein